MNRLAAWLSGLLLVACPMASWAAADQVLPSCIASEAFTTPEETLSQVGVAIAAGGPVDVLAVGSATTVGEQTGVQRNEAYPQQMIEMLGRLLPKVPFHLTVRGGRGMTAEQMLPQLETALTAAKFQLVIWQTGTVEAVRGLRPDAMQEVLQVGIQQAQDRGADVILIDPQFSRFLRANADLDPYEVALQQTAAMPGVVLFRRFDLMREWADEGLIDLERAPRAAHHRIMAQLNACLGDALARFILTGAGVALH